ncbi:MAG: methyltransferase domain-containing protein [Longimicrobiales bacterium]|nr:methyltransferase domain-containing protein [Longimicrobiales bacterium]
MILSSTSPDGNAVARHYDELDPFYRALWGEHLHHGLWTTGQESPAEAALALVDEVARRAGIVAGAEVCDVGSGYGAVARRLAARGARVTGLTVSEAQHRYARVQDARVQEARVQEAGVQEAGGGVRFLLRDWMANGLDAGSFDGVIAIESLSHMRDPGRAVAEAYRVLRPGGRFVACVWLAAERPAPWEVRWLLRPICDEGRLPGLPAPSDYGRWLGAAGFVDAALDDVSRRVARTWAVVARRVAGALLRPAAWRYLLDGRHTERAFALSVLRLLVAFRTGAVRYGIVEARKPDRPGAWGRPN